MALRSRRSGFGEAEKTAQHRLKVHMAIESVGVGAEVLAGVTAEFECLVGAFDQGFEVAQWFRIAQLARNGRTLFSHVRPCHHWAAH